MTGLTVVRRLAFLCVATVLIATVAVACGGDDDDEPAVTATATDVSEAGDAGEGDDTSDPTATDAALEATATAVGPTATASSTPAGGGAALDPGLLVIPTARDTAIPQNGRVLGNPDAAVSIVEYGDFQ